MMMNITSTTSNLFHTVLYIIFLPSQDACNALADGLRDAFIGVPAPLVSDRKHLGDGDLGCLLAALRLSELPLDHMR